MRVGTGFMLPNVAYDVAYVEVLKAADCLGSGATLGFC
jgi:hypothetical protein